MPIPPAWMSTRMMVCPIGVNAVAVSTTTSPVTQTALVEVNNASITLSSMLVELGNNSSNVQITMSNTKLMRNTIAGF